MNRISSAMIRLSIAAVVGGAALFWNGEVRLDSQSALMSSAEARIGRPLTPMSYAGVARRTTRRAVAVGAGVAVGAAAAGAVYAAPSAGCVQRQVTDVYGRIVVICQ